MEKELVRIVLYTVSISKKGAKAPAYRKEELFMKKCPNCGQTSDDKFCPYCGTSLQETAEGPAQTSSDPAAFDAAGDTAGTDTAQTENPIADNGYTGNVPPFPEEQSADYMGTDHQQSYQNSYDWQNQYSHQSMPHQETGNSFFSGTMGSYQPDGMQIPREYQPISMWGYFGYTVLFSIPCIGFIFLCIFAFGGTVNLNLKNYARSYFCACIIGIVLMVIFWMIFVFVLAGSGAHYYYYGY